MAGSRKAAAARADGLRAAVLGDPAKEILAPLAGVCTLTRADSSEELARLADVDLVLVAGALTELEGLVRAASQANGRLPVVAVLPDGAAARDLRRLLAAGADGIVLEADVPAALAPTVQAVHGGQMVGPRALWGGLERPVLSRREKQILAMVVMGFSNGEIAQRLFVTEATVKSHLSSAFGKLGVRSRSEATQRILDPQHGLGTGILAISDENDGDTG